MKIRYEIYLLNFFCIITTNITAQYYNDSIEWDLSSNDSVSSSTWSLRGLKQNLGNDIPAAIYSNGYQKITNPTAGWSLIIDTNLNNSFIEFSFGTHPDVCYDTTGGGQFCLGYNYFSLK